MNLKEIRVSRKLKVQEVSDYAGAGEKTGDFVWHDYWKWR